MEEKTIEQYEAGTLVELTDTSRRLLDHIKKDVAEKTGTTPTDKELVQYAIINMVINDSTL